MVKPNYDYLLVERIEKDKGVLIENDIEDTHQHFRVLAVSREQGTYTAGFKIYTGFKPGDTIYAVKHADADTPDDLKAKNQALIHITRVMGWS